jgi:anti-sigma factor RsiW
MSERDTDTLLAAYLDGVGELTAEERRRVEARLAEDGALRDEAEATRGLLGQLRELPGAGVEPDWAAMERAIRDEVGPDVPRPWWRGWRWLVPIGALAMAGAVLALVLHHPAPAPTHREPIAVRPPVGTNDAGTAPVVAPVAPGDEASIPLWLDGDAVEVGVAADELLGPDERMPGLPSGDDDAVGLLPAGDLAWVDELGDDEVAAAEAWLARKKS